MGLIVRLGFTVIVYKSRLSCQVYRFLAKPIDSCRPRLLCDVQDRGHRVNRPVLTLGARARIGGNSQPLPFKARELQAKSHTRSRRLRPYGWG